MNATTKAAILLMLIFAPGLAVVCGDAAAEVILSSASFPPDADPADCDQVASVYQAPEGSYLFFDAGYALAIQDPVLKCFEIIEREQLDAFTERQRFNATMLAEARWSHITGAVILTGTMETVVSCGPACGFVFEITALDLTTTFNGIPIAIRESPSLLSSGVFLTSDLGDGRYAVDSSFDLSIELVGETVIPEETPVHMGLISTGDLTALVSETSWGAIRSVFR